jgi:pyruvate/2-oxoglutarate/acetoin dehydrogenase E1 component/TPP-dependent pyruvate/acetoin dehydrogenase alpha subunit
MHVAQATPILEGGGAPTAPRIDAEAAAGPEAPDHGLTRDGVLYDYRIVCQSRQVSLLGRREVLTGKAKFGIFGDGKEVAQVAMARAFRRGDLRSGYYRDQTFHFALGILSIEQFFAQLYADPDVVREPCSAGRSMTAHFATCFVDHEGRFVDLASRYNSTADVSPTGAQMPRLVGLAYASRLYREVPGLDEGPRRRFSTHGDEIAWGTIGNATCAEGVFWEAVNAVGVLQAPMILSIWDDGYGISVPNELQITKGDLSTLLSGFRRTPGERRGYDLYTIPGWDYPALSAAYREAAESVRAEQVPAIFHVVELTQPQGHSTSGSHERYKTAERLDWEAEYDCLKKMRQWILGQGLAEEAELERLEEEERERVRDGQRRAWEEFRAPLEAEKRTVLALAAALAAGAAEGAARSAVEAAAAELARQPNVFRRDVLSAVEAMLVAARGEDSAERRRLLDWKREQAPRNRDRYASSLWSETPRAALAVAPVVPVYAESSPVVNGHEVLNACFDAALARIPELVAMGEDLGRLGDVNQGFAGLQAKYGSLRVADTGIREATIIGQAIGMAMRGLRPIAEIQYLDYMLYALQIIADDLANVRYRTKGQQIAPVIIRTRGHRLEGIWHSGSPMGGILNLVRGVHVCVPRNMTQAAGFYNTLLAGDDPGMVVEVLNAYRSKERLPENVGELRVPLGVPEVLRAGRDVTVVTYGACCRIALDAAEMLAGVGIEIEIVDVQTLLPFDRAGVIGESLQKTNRVLFLDEDVPGGASAYMFQQTLELQGGYGWLDARPRTLSGAAHRPAYGSDGDYFSKPNRESIFEAVYELMHEGNPQRFPIFFK